ILPRHNFKKLRRFISSLSLDKLNDQLKGTYCPPKTITYRMIKTPIEAKIAAINNKRCDFRVFLKMMMRAGTIFPRTLSTQIYKKLNLPRRTSSTVSKASSVWYYTTV